MAKLTLSNITSGFESNTTQNANNDLIELALENTLSRDGTSPNQMGANLDMNGFMILNQANPIAISGFTWEGPWITAQAYSIGDIIESNGTAYIAIVAHTSGVFLTDLGSNYWQTLVTTAGIPSQIGQANKFLQTDGAATSWQVPDASEVSFTQSGTGGVATTVLEKLKQRKHIFDFMTSAEIADVVAGTLLTDVTAKIQAAIDAVTSLGGIVEFGAGSYLISSTLILPSKVYLLGQGSSNTKIWLANASNCTMLETTGFNTLTLQNKWLISENVPYGFGFDGITFDGNRANQTAGNGVSIYGKGYHIGFDVKIVNAKEIGFYSECAFKGGQVVEQDMPEGNIGKVQVYMSGKEGFVYRGPHDQTIHEVFVSQAGQDGVYDGVAFEAQTNIYQGATYITGQIHSYACTGRGISVRCFLPAANCLTGENNDRDGVVFEAAGETVGMIGSLFSNIDFVEAYGNDNNDTGLYWGIRCSGASNQLTSLRASCAGQSAGGVYISGNLNTVGGGTVTGVNAIADGTGLKVDGNYQKVKLIIENFDSGINTVGLHTSGCGYSTIDVTLFNCAVTGWLNSGASTNNLYTVSGFSTAGTPFSQTGSFSVTDNFNITLNYAGTPYLSRYNDSVQKGILQPNTSVTVTHNGFKIPGPGDITITPDENWCVLSTGVARNWWISNITATTFNVNVNTAVEVAETSLLFHWKLNI
jgi:hypothetical protein